MLRAESHAGVVNAEIDSSAMTRQPSLGLRSSAGLHDVPQGLLRDPKQAQSHLVRNLPRNMVMDKLNLQIVLPGEFVTEAAQSGDQTQRVKLVWVKLMGQVVKAGRNLRGYLCNVVQLLPNLGGKAACLFRYLLQTDLEKSHPLTQIVV